MSDSTIRLPLHPEDVEPQERFVGVELELSVPPSYPTDAASIRLVHPRGLDQTQLTWYAPGDDEACACRVRLLPSMTNVPAVYCSLQAEAEQTALEAAEDESVAVFAIVQVR